MKKLPCLLLLLCTLAANAQLSVKEHTLCNGLKVWLHEDHTTPTVLGAVVVKAGAIDSPGTGIAHYFEHIAFKGTDKIGTIDYQKEKPLLDSIEAYYGELKLQSTDSARLEIQKKINHLSIEAAKYAIPGEFDLLLKTYGGSNVNAYTSYDRTVYHNSFSPQYIAQWCELNSERMISPVFRLFQSELETVYEEKNMMENNILNKSMERLYQIYYNDSPYSLPLVGTRENLKNPDMAAMRAYFDKFYNASNMMLLISGDFNSAELLPLLEQTFGRIKRGEVVERNYTESKQIKGRVNVELKLPLPIIRGRAYGWKGLAESNPDRFALRLASDVLSSENGTGYLDSLTAKGKWMFCALLAQSMTHEGVLAAIVMPNLLGGSFKKAEKLIFEQIDRVKRGDIDPVFFQSVKLALKKEYDGQIENFDRRNDVLISLMVVGKPWEQYLSEIDNINRLTIDDVAAAARKYLNDNYYCATKKYGSYKREEPLQKPPFAPIKPHNVGAQSAYAQQLAKLPTTSAKPKFVDVNSSVDIVEIAPLVKLYASQNTINDLFSLTLRFGKGSRNDKRLEYAVEYLNQVGSDSMELVRFKSELHRLGVEVRFDSYIYETAATLSGYERNFDEALALFSHFICNVGKDQKAVKRVISDKVISNSMRTRSANSVASALLNHVQLGDKSPMKTDLTVAQVKKIKAEHYVAIFDDARQSECKITYFGTLGAGEVAKRLTAVYDFANVKNPISFENQRNNLGYTEPTVYFVDYPRATQAIIYAYTLIEADLTPANDMRALLATYCIGRGLNSILFRNIREYRSLAYSTWGAMSFKPPVQDHRQGVFVSQVSTQNDKAHEALGVLDSLYTNMEFDSAQMVNAKRSMINDIFHNYPTLRALPSAVVDKINDGYLESPEKYQFENVQGVSGEELLDFYHRAIGDHKIVYVVVGNAKKIDMQALEKFGKLVKLKTKDLIEK